MNHIVALSGGKDSTALALRLKEIEPRDYVYVCTPTGDELPEMIEHWEGLERLLQTPLTRITANYTLGGLILKQKALPNHQMRWCTVQLKIEPFQKFIVSHLPCTAYIGIRADEVDQRDGVDWQALTGVTQRWPFVEWGWGITEVQQYLLEKQVTIPDRTDCAMCFFQTPYEWYQLWLNHPKLFARAKAYESLVGHTFRYRNQLRREPEKKWPAALEDLEELFEAGQIPTTRKMKDRQQMCSVCAR